MPRFNKTATPRTRPTATNQAGGVAFQQDAKTALVSLLLTSMLQDGYYEKASDQMSRLATLMAGCEPKFAAKAAIYARNTFGMRTITHVAVANLAKTVHGEPWLKNFYEKIARRPDDILETLAFLENNHIKLPNAMRKGFGAALSRFDHYQLAKYRKDGAQVSLVDAVNLLHPKATPALTALMTGTLQPAETWETKMTKAGQSTDDETALKNKKADVWASLIRERKLGYFALLRNLRNIIETCESGVVSDALAMLTDRRLIRQSLVLPFRFYTAAVTLQKDLATHPQLKRTIAALEEALNIACANVPKFDGPSLVVIDHSASMGLGYDSNFAKGALFGYIVLQAQEVCSLMHFGDTAKYLPIPSGGVLTSITRLERLNEYGERLGVGHGTNFDAIFDEAVHAYKRVFIFSDMQGWMGQNRGAPTAAFTNYCRKFNCRPWVYCFDLTGSGTSMFPEHQYVQLAGYSEKIFDFIDALENRRDGMIQAIDNVEL